MSRTRRVDNTRDGHAYWATNARPYYNREAKWARKSTNRKARNATNEIIATTTTELGGIAFDGIAFPLNPSTGGWITH